MKRARPVLVHSTAALLSSSHPKALIILNYEFDRDILMHFWDRSCIRVCADGAANRLFDCLTPGERRSHVPDAIVGDLDSIRPDVKSFYTDLGGSIFQEVPNQDIHDFAKSLTRAEQLSADLFSAEGSSGVSEMSHTVILGGLGGRLDQTFANIAALHDQATPRLHLGDLVLMDSSCLALLLGPSEEEHTILPSPEVEGPLCGIIPIDGPTSAVTSTGLRWNLDGLELGIGKVVSSSNEIVGEKVTIKTDKLLLWTSVIEGKGNYFSDAAAAASTFKADDSK